MKDYKTPDARLVKLFKSEKDSWRERALLKQQKIQELEKKLEYTRISRDKWKVKSNKHLDELKTLKSLLKKKEAEIRILKKKKLTT